MMISEQYPFDVNTLVLVLIGDSDLVFTCIYMYLHVFTCINWVSQNIKSWFEHTRFEEHQMF